MASKISLVKSFTNTEQVPCLVHMNVIVNILYLHIYKITVCSVDCSFNVLLRQSQGYDVKGKKKACATSLKRKQLRHVYAAQSHATMTTLAKVRRAKASSLFLACDMNKEKRITLLQIRSHVL